MDHYETLGISRDATQEQIKRAYRKHAKRVHPDRTGGSDQAMSAVNGAYETLSNPTRRLRYDRTGSDNVVDIEIAARNSLLGRFIAWLNNETKITGMVAEIRFTIEQEILQQTQHQAAIMRICGQARAKLKRLKFKGKGPDPLRDLIDFQLSSVEKQAEQVQEKLDILRASIPLLDNYEFKDGAIVTEAQQPQMFGPGIFVIR
jgi:curved DNA-binding protein CbpA